MRDILKTQTRDLHIELDEAFSELKLQNHQHYGKFLIAHAWVIIPLEKQLIRSEKFNIIPSAEKRLRTSSLKSDLSCLALNEPETNSTTMSYINALSEIAGIMYVLEGSRLGAKTLVNQLKETPSHYPKSFLNHGEGERFWSSYISWLNSNSWKKEEQEEAIAAAQNVFELYLQAVEKFMQPHRATNYE